MKKIIIILAVIIIYIFINTNEYVVIPEESIRFRVVPNSNDVEDIFAKEKVLLKLIDKLTIKNNFNDAKTEIEKEIPLIKKEISNLFKEINYNKKFSISFGNNYFPKKVYNGVLYKEGYYESLVVTIGEGKGSNFWCVLFPPLCMLENEDSTNEIEYKFKVKEIIEKLMNK